MNRGLHLCLCLLASSLACGQPPQLHRDEATGLSFPLPAADWKLMDQSQGGVLVRIYSPATPPLPRVTVMRFPKLFMPQGMRTRAMQIKALMGGEGLKELQDVRLAGRAAKLLEYTGRGVRTKEVGLISGDHLLILQVAAAEKDWEDPARRSVYERVFEAATLGDPSEREVELRFADRTPEEIRGLRGKAAPGPRRTAVLSHDIHLAIEPEAGTLHVKDTLEIQCLEAKADTLVLHCLPQGILGFSTNGARLTWEKSGENEVTVRLPRPLRREERLTLVFEAHHERFLHQTDSSMVQEISVFGQVTGESSYSSHVLYYPVDALNDAPVKMAIRVPRGHVAVSGGVPDGRTVEQDHVVFRFRMDLKAPRQLPLGWAVGRYEQLGTRTPSGVELIFHHPKDLAEETRQRLPIARKAGALLERLMGPLPWKQVSFAHVRPVRKEMGVSLPGLILVSDLFYGDAAGVVLEGRNLNEPRTLGLLLVADELSHQWNFYSVALPNELAEGISTFTNLLLVEELSGKEEYQAGLDVCAQAYLLMAESEEDLALADPNLYRSPSYRTVAFCKVPLVLDILRQELGDRLFFDSWRKAFQRLRGRKCEYTDLERALSSASGRDLAPFFEQWFFRPGHPRIHVTWKSNPSGDTLVTIRQTHPAGPYRFTLPITITFKDSARPPLHKRLPLSKPEETFTFPAAIATITPSPSFPLLRTRLTPPPPR